MEVIPAVDLVTFKNCINDFYHQLILILKYPNNNLDYDLFDFEIKTFLNQINQYPYCQLNNCEKNIIDCLKCLVCDGELKKNIKKKSFEKKILKIYPNHQG